MYLIKNEQGKYLGKNIGITGNTWVTKLEDVQGFPTYEKAKEEAREHERIVEI